jgi:hypothetical protein
MVEAVFNKKDNSNSVWNKFALLIIIIIFILSSVSVAGMITGQGHEPLARGPRENQYPFVNITEPESEARVSGVITIRGYAWDVDGYITKVKVRLGDVWYNATDDSGNSSWYKWSLRYNTTILANGEHRIVALAYDNGSLLGDFGRWIIVNNTGVSENQRPFVNITQPEAEARVSGIITIKGFAWDNDGNVTAVKVIIAETKYNATDDSGNGSWYKWSLVFNTSILEDGEHLLKAIAYDDGDKAEDFGRWIIVKNHEDPKENHWPYVNITHPKNEAKVSGIITIKGHAWDIDGNITLVQVRIADVWYNATDDSGNGSWYKWSLVFNTSKLEDGEYRIVVLSKDDGGKLGDFGRWIIIKNNPDPKENHWPYVNITQPKSEEKVSGNITIKGHAWDIDGNITKVRIKIADVWYNATDTSGNGSWYYWSLVFDTTILSDDEYRIVAISYDDGDKLGDYGVWIIVDNEPDPKENHWPYITITQPKHEAKVSGTIKIKGRAWDIDGNVTSVRVRIADVWYNATDTSGNGTWYYWSLDYNTSKLKNGEYRVVVLAKDNGGKLGDEGIWIIVNNPREQENKVPFVKIEFPLPGANASGVIVIKGRAWDVDGEITSVRIRIGKVYFDAKDTSENGTWYTWEFEWNTTKYENGTHTIKVVVSDGKAHEDAEVKIKVQNQPDGKKEQKHDRTKKKRWPIPGFEGPLALIAAIIAVVVAFFRSGDIRGRNK